MPDAGDDRQGEVGHVAGQVEGVESREVAGGSPTPRDDHAVELADTLVDGVESGDDALLHPFALHDRGEELRVEHEPVFIVGELVAEVAVACGIGTGDDGDAVGEERQREFFVECEHPLVGEDAYDLLSFASHVAHGVCGVDVLYNP